MCGVVARFSFTCLDVFMLAPAVPVLLPRVGGHFKDEIINKFWKEQF
jgi:hypothetical protein